MRHRKLAAIAATATVAAAPTAAIVIEEVTTAPPAAADYVPVGYPHENCALSSPALSGNTVATAMLTYSKGSFCDFPGTFSLQASLDHSHWKTVAQTHQTRWQYEQVSNPCLAGTWWYQGYFVADDGSFKRGTDSAVPTKFTC